MTASFGKTLVLLADVLVLWGSLEVLMVDSGNGYAFVTAFCALLYLAFIALNLLTELASFKFSYHAEFESVKDKGQIDSMQMPGGAVRYRTERAVRRESSRPLLKFQPLVCGNQRSCWF